MTRLLTAAVAVPLLVLIIMRGPPELFLALVAAVALGGYHELSKLLGGPPMSVGYLMVALIALAPHPQLPSTGHVLALAAVLLGTLAVVAPSPGRQTVERVISTGFGLLYLGVPLGAVSAVRLGAEDGEARLWIVFLLAVIMVGDAGAYYVGSTVGRHKLAPALSPKKTVEGLAGGVFASIATAATVRALFMPSLPLSRAIALALVLALAGVAGDLFESLLKRSAGVKDASSIFPGHGGVLDRIDSLLFASPLLFLYLEWF